MRYIVVIVAWLLCKSAMASGALILLDFNAAGPHVDPNTYYHPTWVLWPPSLSNGTNRILSVATGHDLRADDRDLAFAPISGDRWQSLNIDSLRKRGILNIGTRTKLYPVESPAGRIDPAILFLGLEPNGKVESLPWNSTWPEEGTFVAAAKSWDEVKAITLRAKHRSLVLEFPPPPNQRLSRFWLYGEGWQGNLLPEDPNTGVQGLIPARKTVFLLTDPPRFVWTQNKVEQWGGAFRWQEHKRVLRTFLWPCFLGVLILAIGLSSLYVIREKESRTLANFILVVALMPASFILAGQSTYLFGLGSWFLWHGLALATCLLLLPLARRLLGTNSVQSTGLIGGLVLILCDPKWSLFSGSYEFDRNGILLGLSASYLCVAFAHSGFTSRTLLAVGIVAIGVVLRLPEMVIAALIAYMSPLRWHSPWLILLLLLPLVVRASYMGVSWMPQEFPSSTDHVAQLNLARHFQFFTSTPLLILLSVALVYGVVCDRFFWHQLRLLLRQDPRRQSLPKASILLLAIGFAYPPVLPAFIVALAGVSLWLLHDALRIL